MFFNDILNNKEHYHYICKITKDVHKLHFINNKDAREASDNNEF